MYDLGIIGGMGPKATNIAFGRIIDYTYANRDQEHISIIILNNTKIPDRTMAILNNENEIIGILKNEFNTMEKLNIPIVIVACNTSHFFIRKIEKNVIFIDAINETKSYFYKTYKDKALCILGTTGLITSNVFCKSEEKPLIIYPDSDTQAGIMDIINKIKSGTDTSIMSLRMLEYMEKLQGKNGNIVFILACTEISLMRDYLMKKFICVDCLDVLITQAICQCGYKINDKPGQFLSNISYFLDDNYSVGE